MNRSTGGPSTGARIPTGDARARRNAGQAVAGTSLGPPFVVDRRSGQQQFAFDDSLEILAGTGELSVRHDATLRTTSAGVGMAPAARVDPLASTATLGEVIAAFNALIKARRDAGEQRA